MIRKEFRQVLRNPRTRAMLFLPPVMQLLIFGYAVNLDVNYAQIAWMDEDRSPQSRELLARFEGSGLFQILATPANQTEMQDLLDRSTVDGVVRVLPGFARDLERGRSTNVQILLDGTDSNSTQLVSGYAGQVIARFTADIMTEKQRERLVAAGVPVSAANRDSDATTEYTVEISLLRIVVTCSAKVSPRPIPKNHEAQSTPADECFLNVASELFICRL